VRQSLKVGGGGVISKRADLSRKRWGTCGEEAHHTGTLEGLSKVLRGRRGKVESSSYEKFECSDNVEREKRIYQRDKDIKLLVSSIDCVRWGAWGKQDRGVRKEGT